MDSASLNSQVPEFRFRSSEPAEDEIRSESTSGAGSGDGNAAHLSGGAKYRLMSPAKLPISRPAGGITVPPGLSPTSFLDSPVLLSNMKVEPSPTTGSFGTHRILHGSVGSPTNIRAPNSSSGNGSTEGWPSYFEFKQPSRANLVHGELNQRNELPVQVQGLCQSKSFTMCSMSELAVSSNELTLTPAKQVPSVTNAPAEVDPEKLNQKEHFQSENRSIEGSTSLLMTENLSDDGYNWRKYGQKLVKGSEFPRSYYKCTHPNCEVKKLFERSPEGRITEIIYKGTHDHPKPQPGRGFATGMVMPIQEEKSEKVSSSTADKSSNMYGQSSCNIEPNGTLDLYPVAGNEDSIEGIGSSSKTIHDEADEDDFLSKRRRLDIGALDVTPVVKPIREPRVVVQTLSEVDILDDGYRWRKYGQKVVRGNPNPRSYYKCTNAGCLVRKHVERASHDPKAVITSYEGKHNHDVPVGKNNASDTASQAASPGISCIRPEEVETVSLDLEVGISSSSAAENNSRSTEQQIPHSMHQQEFAQNQAQLSSSGFQVPQANSFPSYYGRAGAYGLIENINGSRGVAEAPPPKPFIFPVPSEHGKSTNGAIKLC